MAAPNLTRKVYNTVVEDVIASVREAFLDEGVDEQVLQELKHSWEAKLNQSRALEPVVSETEQLLQGGNMPYIMQAQPTHTQAQSSQQGQAIQQQIPIPVQIGPDGQISGAATMAFNAQGGVFQQHLQALVNVPGMNSGQFTVQQGPGGQYIIQAVPQTIGVPHTQVMTIPQQQQNVIQTQNPQIRQTHPGIPQLDGTHDCDLHSEAAFSSIRPDSPQPSTSKSEEPEEPSCHKICCSQLESVVTTDGEVYSQLESDVTTDGEVCSQSTAKGEFSIIIEGLLGKIPQLDGGHDTSSSEEDNYDENDNDDDDDDDEKEDAEEGDGEEEEPLNSGDDVSEEDPTELFDTENVVVCQFEKISRNKNKWKFSLKDGIMNLNGRDHLFQKGTGDADW